MVEADGIEPTTNRLKIDCSTYLSYASFQFWPAFRGLELLFHSSLLPCVLGGGRWTRTTPPEGNRFTACRRALQLIDHRSLVLIQVLNSLS